MSENQTEKRGRGRPSSFPGQETVAVVSTIPVTVRDMARELAEQREEPLNVVIARAIERLHRDATRTRNRKSTASPA